MYVERDIKTREREGREERRGGENYRNKREEERERVRANRNK